MYSSLPLVYNFYKLISGDLHLSRYDAGFILILVQLMLDVVLFALISLTVQFFLGQLYHGVFFGPSYLNMLGTGIHLTLAAMTLRVFMDIRYVVFLSLVYHRGRLLWLSSWGVRQGITLLKEWLRGGPHLSLCFGTWGVHEWCFVLQWMFKGYGIYDYKSCDILQLQDFKFNRTGNFVSFSGVLYAYCMRWF